MVFSQNYSQILWLAPIKAGDKRATITRSCPKLLVTSRAHLCLAVLIFLFLLTGARHGALAQGYQLGPQDRIRVTVVEWVLDELRSPINGEFIVSATGSVSLPLIGEVPAAGIALSDLASSVSQRLQTKLGLTERPNTSIEVVAFRPFYILGDVDRSGEYAYRPGMTVLQAISLAGGFRRPEAARLQLERDAQSDLRASSMSVDELVAREARLRAEIDESGAVRFPPELESRKTGRNVSELLNAEILLFEARRRTRDSEVDASAKLMMLFDEEIASLDKHSRALGEQQEASKRQLGLLSNLKERGLASPGREFDLERMLADVQSKQREIETQAVRIQQERAKTESTIGKSKDQRQLEAATELRQIRTALAQFGQRAETARRVLSMTATPDPNGAKRDYVIIRQTDPDRQASIVAQEATAIRPGDVLQVTIRAEQPHLVDPSGLPDASTNHDPQVGTKAAEEIGSPSPSEP
jgi:polysaccharide biosynthesis/export protein ExoF